MNVFLGTMRKIALGGIVVLILSLILKGIFPSGNMRIYLLSCIPGYLLFTFFTWLSAKSTISALSDKFQEDLPSDNFLITLLKALLLDMLSPVTSFFGLFGSLSAKWFIFISTYVIVGAYVLIWFKLF